MTNHELLVEDLISAGVLRTPAVIDAFRAIDRRGFVRKDTEDEAYVNAPLPIGKGQTISQPLTVAFMLELLQPRAGDNVLDIGSGSGWQTALLAHIVGGRGQVTAMEIIPKLCQWGQDNVARYNYVKKGTVEVRCTSGLDGCPDKAPFNRIIAAAAGETVPEAWLEQTEVGGSVVTPVGSSILRLIKKGKKEWERYDYPGFAFVPLVEKPYGQSA